MALSTHTFAAFSVVEDIAEDEPPAAQTIQKKAVSKETKTKKTPTLKPKAADKSTVKSDEDFDSFNKEIEATDGNDEIKEAEDTREEWEKWDISESADYDSLETIQTNRNKMLVFKYSEDETGVIKPKPDSIHANKHNIVHKTLNNPKALIALTIAWLLLAIAVILVFYWGWKDSKERKKNKSRAKRTASPAANRNQTKNKRK